ncbi:MAG: hypothetical protein ACYC6N_29930 [Pirellulaceae bacterium]
MSHERYASCIEACVTCAQECEHCADACLSEQNVKMMAECIRLDLVPPEESPAFSTV